MVTGDAGREGMESRKSQCWSRPMSCATLQATFLDTLIGKCRGTPPGSEAASSLTRRLRGNQGDPTVGVLESALPWTSLGSEEEGSDCRKSEAPVVAVKSGNSDGAKGCRFEVTDKEHMPRHRAEVDHDKAPYSFHTESRASVDDSNWEPDGLTDQVRFCEGPGTNWCMDEILWHRRETRR